MADKELTVADIMDWVGQRSFDRGLDYADSGQIINPRRQGEKLKSECWGSAAYPYRVEIGLSASGIEFGSCSCPVGDGGHCKHAAALLLTWLNQADEFHELEDTGKALDELSKEELIAIIKQMTARHPDLEALIETELARPPEGAPIDADWITRQTFQAFSAGDDDWRASYHISADLFHVLQPGVGYIERGEWANAFVLYSTVARRVIQEYDSVHDEESELINVIIDCCEGLEGCLATDDTDLRKGILQALFEIYRWDTDSGGYGAAEMIPEVVLDSTTPDEKRMVAQWLRGALPTGEGMTGEWRRQNYGAFLLGLEKEWLDDEAFLRLCRETGRWADLIERLLTLEDVAQALAVAREQSDYALLALADVFVAHGQSAVARKLVGERASSSEDGRLIAWLRTEAIARGDLGAALVLTERLFWRRPVLTGYLEMQELARALALWDDFCDPLLTRLEDQRMYALLTAIHLHEGDVEQALETYQQAAQVNERAFGWSDYSLRVQVAKAAEKDFPFEAIRLFEEHVEKLIDGRSRGAYAEAAPYVINIRAIYRRLDDEAGWMAYITGLRDRHRRLRALHDELRLAGV